MKAISVKQLVTRIKGYIERIPVSEKNKEIIVEFNKDLETYQNYTELETRINLLTFLLRRVRAFIARSYGEVN